ncbi:MAG: hypothetical protein H6999_06090 [Hahellaceae bacterium]|nr:hypothetical protein [Hahellaceae bacterium]MCP5169311.1 hypothetical protein [Hahellaceae bacterium]
MKVTSVLKKFSKKGAVTALVMVQLSGCSFINNIIYKTTGDVMQNFSKDHTIPYVLSTDDLAVSCAMSESLSPLLMSFGRVTNEPNTLAVMLNMSAGACEEERALEQELRYMRAIKEFRPDEAEDALILQKRHLVNAAKRQYEAWKRLTAHFGEPGGASCPTLSDDFDQFIWMAGMLAGLQALNNEIMSTTSVGVPKNIAAKVERGASCLEDDKWWGVPMAMKATVWAMLPGAEPKGENAWARLEAADKKGEKAHIRLTHVLHALAANTKGDMERVRNVIRTHADQIKKHPSDEQNRLLDAIATAQLTALSDRLWTQNTGHRTPVGGFGTFWDDKKESTVEGISLDDLL